MRPLVSCHSPETVASRIASQLDLRTLIAEYDQFSEGVNTYAEELSRTDDMDDLRHFLATVTEFREGLYRAEAPARMRLYDLERWERNNTLWMAGESL
jgi:hypothetical protein